MTDEIDREIEASLNREFGVHGTMKAMRAVDTDAGREVRPSVIPSDGKRRRIEMLRDDISRHDAALIEIGRRRDIEVRDRTAEIAEARRAFDELSARLDREIVEIENRARYRIALRSQLRDASLASLAVLEKPEGSQP